MNNVTRLCLVVYDRIYETREKFRNNEVVDVDKELFERICNEQSSILEEMERERMK